MSTTNQSRGLVLLATGLLLAGWSLAAVPTMATEGEAPGRAVSDQGNAHLQSPGSPHEPYNSDPPTSGPHVRWVAPWGVHKAPVPLEVQVHNLEDGGVVIQYNCDCPDLVAKLETFPLHPAVTSIPRAMFRHGDQTGSRLVVAPYPAMKHKIALTAWGRIDTMDHYDETRILQFIKAYIGIDHHPSASTP
jgi:hypothetical protein